MLSESEIINGCKKGKRHAFNMLYDKYASIMLGLCMRYSRTRVEAEDILQEGFIKVFKNIKTFEGRGSFEGWMKRIMVNTAINHYKSNKRHHDVYDFEETKLVDGSLEEENFEFDSNYKQEELMKMINNLPDGYRMVFNLYVFEGMNHKEIADILGFTVSTSKSQLSKARKLLRKKLAEKQHMAIENER